MAFFIFIGTAVAFIALGHVPGPPAEAYFDGKGHENIQPIDSVAAATFVLRHESGSGE
jgi:hypothetical protein